MVVYVSSEHLKNDRWDVLSMALQRVANDSNLPVNENDISNIATDLENLGLKTRWVYNSGAVGIMLSTSGLVRDDKRLKISRRDNLFLFEYE